MAIVSVLDYLESLFKMSAFFGSLSKNSLSFLVKIFNGN